MDRGVPGSQADAKASIDTAAARVLGDDLVQGEDLEPEGERTQLFEDSNS